MEHSFSWLRRPCPCPGATWSCHRTAGHRVGPQVGPLWEHFQFSFRRLSRTLCPSLYVSSLQTKRLFPWPLLHSETTKRPGWDSRSNHGSTDVSKSGSGVSALMRVFAVPFSLFPSGDGSSPGLATLTCFLSVAHNLQTVPDNAFREQSGFPSVGPFYWLSGLSQQTRGLGPFAGRSLGESSGNSTSM